MVMQYLNFVEKLHVYFALETEKIAIWL